MIDEWVFLQGNQFEGFVSRGAADYLIDSAIKYALT
jgi:hypothetical protein